MSEPSAPPDPPAPAREHRLFRLDELADGRMRRCEVEGRAIVVCRVGDRVHALDDTCAHDGVSLSLGALEGGRLRCPLHGSEFDVTTGRVLCEPAEVDLVRHQARVEGGEVVVTLAGGERDANADG